MQEEVIKMHEAFCGENDRWETYGPCLKFKIKQESAGEGGEKKLSKEQYEAEMEKVKEKVPVELGQQQARNDGPDAIRLGRMPRPRMPHSQPWTSMPYRAPHSQPSASDVLRTRSQMDEMHDYWCEREEAGTAAPGSAVHVLCENYQLHKIAKQEL